MRGLPIAERRAVLDAGYALLQVPIGPLQYPSLEHLDLAVESAITRTENLKAVNATTARWARTSYRAFRRFLKVHNADAAFVRGDLREQVAILESWIIAMSERGLRRGGINSIWRGLASVFRWLTRTNGMTNPVLFVRAPKPGRRHPTFLTKEAAEDVLRFVRNHLWESEFERLRNTVIIGLMVLAGLRRGEVLRVLRADVNLETGKVTVREAKGPDGGNDRTACMPKQLREWVAEYLDAVRKLPPRAHPELITSMRNRAPSYATIARICEVITTTSGIKVAPHMLRHTYATLLRQADVQDRVAMELMGHADLRMLLRYSHVEADEPLRAAERLRLDV
jgi:site-specific recombinase XerD